MLWCLHFIQTTRVHQTRSWVISDRVERPRRAAQVLTEFEELLAQDYDDTEGAFDDPFGGLDDAYAPDQAPAAEASVGCLKVVGQLYKQALLAIDDRGNAGRFDEVSSVYAAADSMREAAVALGEELYAPLMATRYGRLLS